MNDADRKPDNGESAALDADAIVAKVAAHWPRLGAIGAGGLDVLNDALGDGLDADAVAAFVNARWPRLGALGGEGLNELNDALRGLEANLVSAEVLREAEPRTTVLTLMIAMHAVYMAATYDPQRIGTRSPAGDRAFRILINSLLALDCGLQPELFKPTRGNDGGAPRISYDDEEKRFWAAVALTLRAKLTGQSLDSAGKEIAKELGIPHGNRHVVAQWRKDIVSGKRGPYQKSEFKDTVDRFSDPTKPPYSVPAGMAKQMVAHFEKMAITRAQEAAAEENLIRDLRID